VGRRYSLRQENIRRIYRVKESPKVLFVFFVGSAARRPPEDLESNCQVILQLFSHQMMFSSTRIVFADMDSNRIICSQRFLLLVLFRYTGTSLQLAPCAYGARNLCWHELAVEQ